MVLSGPTFTSRVRGTAIIAVIGALVAVLCVLAVLVAGIGNRSGWWDYRVALRILSWSAWTGPVAAVVAALGGTLSMPGHPPRRVTVLAIVGVVLGTLVFAVPWAYLSSGAPLINDITTDTANPPHFVDVLPLRRSAPVRTDYGGDAVAAIQHKAYPDIAPARLPVAPTQAFERALDAARSLGWDIVAAVPAEGRIEATDTTRFMGFMDDVVIRVTPDGAGSRVDVRSLSRVGGGDFGTNAGRIRAFLKRLRP